MSQKKERKGDQPRAVTLSRRATERLQRAENVPLSTSSVSTSAEQPGHLAQTATYSGRVAGLQPVPATLE